MKIETMAVHAGYTPEPTTHAVAVPVYQTTSYSFDDTQHGADLFDHPDKNLVERYMGGRASGILSFGIKGGREAGACFIDALNLVTRLVNIGDAKSLACHPATTTHRQLSAEELKKAGVFEDMVWLSIGIEHVDDILDDIDQALAAA